MPRSVIDRFHAGLVKVFDQPDVCTKFAGTLGMDLAVSSPAALQKLVVFEMARWGNVVREHNVRAE